MSQNGPGLQQHFFSVFFCNFHKKPAKMQKQARNCVRPTEIIRVILSVQERNIFQIDTYLYSGFFLDIFFLLRHNTECLCIETTMPTSDGATNETTEKEMHRAHSLSRTP